MAMGIDPVVWSYYQWLLRKMQELTGANEDGH